MSAQLAISEPVCADHWSTVVDGQQLRYFDRRFNADAIKLLPGEFAGEADNTMLVTILGSCVAACLWDEQAGVGGMNHFMLPCDGGAQTGSGRYGVHAMELLINRLLSLGAERARLRAKLFGGAAVVRSMTQSDVGASNIAFVDNYLKTERIPVVASDLAGPWPRRVHFFAGSGRAFVKRLPVIEAPRIVNDENLHFQRLKASAPQVGSVELF